MGTHGIYAYHQKKINGGKSKDVFCSGGAYRNSLIALKKICQSIKRRATGYEIFNDYQSLS